MSLLNDILSHNQSFVQERKYEPYRTTKFPDKKMVILTCMDTRLVELLPQAMNLRNGDVKIVKNAGAIVSHPFGSVMRSILVAVYALKAQEVCVVGHHDCGMTGLHPDAILESAKKRGISAETIQSLKHAGIELETWLTGFTSVSESVVQSVRMIRNHPLLTKEIPVHGMVIHPDTGKLDLVINGDEDDLSLE